LFTIPKSVAEQVSLLQCVPCQQETERFVKETQTGTVMTASKQEYRTVRARVVATFEPAVVILLEKGQHGNKVIDTQARNSTAVEIPSRDISGTSC
jgi:uncharacterized OB-fold protein